MNKQRIREKMLELKQTFPVYLAQTVVRVLSLDDLPHKPHFSPVVLFERMDRVKPFVHRISCQDTLGMIRVYKGLNDRNTIGKRRELAGGWIHGI
jgi:hypothetical protein